MSTLCARTLVFSVCYAATTTAFSAPPIGKYDDVYTAPFHPAIHNMGNIGLMGRVHARSARCATKLIDRLAYDGVNMRALLARRLAQDAPPKSRLLEIGCGVGTLTCELERTGAFEVVALDTSQEMLDEARRALSPNTTLLCQNAADYGGFADVAVACMVMHEMPKHAHREVLHAMMRSVPNGPVWVVDIDPSYSPSAVMLTGEPYVLKYLEEFEGTLSETCEDRFVDVVSLIPGHVRAWIIFPAP